ncbi:hypothetical protein Hdeb2414_s0017g00505411 [Helianthus debilis subsp. tardiflorus]
MDQPTFTYNWLSIIFHKHNITQICIIMYLEILHYLSHCSLLIYYYLNGYLIQTITSIN